MHTYITYLHAPCAGDIVDKILANLIDSTRTRRQVVRQLILLDLVTNSKQLRKGVSGRVSWSNEEVEQLRNLYELHVDDRGTSVSVLVVRALLVCRLCI